MKENPVILEAGAANGDNTVENGKCVGDTCSSLMVEAGDVERGMAASFVTLKQPPKSGRSIEAKRSDDRKGLEGVARKPAV